LIPWYKGKILLQLLTHAQLLTLWHTNAQDLAEAVDQDEDGEEATAGAVALSNDQEKMVLQLMRAAGSSRQEVNKALLACGGESTAGLKYILWDFSYSFFDLEPEGEAAPVTPNPHPNTQSSEGWTRAEAEDPDGPRYKLSQTDSD
jgi:hypothetical protein